MRMAGADPLRTILSLALAVLWAGAAPAAAPAPGGQRLAACYDAMDVEHHWLPGLRVDWRTGDPVLPTRRGATHCSAFVAAACQRLEIYLLRPPEHSEVQLANAQAEWLAGPGVQLGWRVAGPPLAAQALANEGKVVVAVYQEPDPGRPGHIALVRPSGKPEAQVADEGPQVTQAGGRNAASTSLRQGFRLHPGAWSSDQDYRVRFYVHDLP